MIFTADSCQGCCASNAPTSFGGESLCDRCLDSRIAQITGFPELPDPPSPLSIRDAHDVPHLMRFRIWRAPSGIVVDLDEPDQPPSEGFRFSVIGDHHADVDELIARVSAAARDEMSHQYLTSNPHRDGWLLAGDEVAGRLSWSDGADNGVGTPYVAIVEGRTLSWEELGRALEGFEGFRFRLIIEDRSEVVDSQ